MAQENKREIDLNAADVETLQQIEGVDSQRARLIVDHRESHGTFENWEQLELIDGIGPKLVEKLKASARLGSAGADGSGAAASEEDGEAEESLLGDDELVEALTGLAELDSEAAAAYEVASEALEDEDEGMRRMLLEFQQDHLRHVRELNATIERSGGSPVEQEARSNESFLGRLADTAAALGPKGLLVAMIGNEMLTNGTYLSALQLPCDEEVRKLLLQNHADEQRHLRWLLEARKRLGVEFPMETAPA